MMWTRSFLSLSKVSNIRKGISEFHAPLHHNLRICGNGIDVQVSLDLLPLGVGQLDTVLQKRGLADGCLNLRDNVIVARNFLGRFELSHGFQGRWNLAKQSRKEVTRHFGHGGDPQLDRNFLVQLWLADRKMRSFREKKKRKTAKYTDHDATMYDNQSSSKSLFQKLFSNPSAAEEKRYDNSKPILKQPPLSQSATGLLNPSSQEEAQVAPLLARSNLLITRDIEWANLMLGFEQENRYAIVDVCYPQSPVGFIREQSNLLARQFLRRRRPFIAYITDAMGNELFRVRRPFWWITSSISAEINGKEIGVVHQRWHLWRRVYDLYLGNKQFAVVENPGFWNWTFTLKDIDGEVLAEIDRNWRGFGFEVLTDAGQYVIRFGHADPISKSGAAEMIQELDVKRPLTLSERAITLALAISLDNDYFSRHSGWGLPMFVTTE